MNKKSLFVIELASLLLLAVSTAAAADKLWIEGGSSDSTTIPPINLPSFAPAIEELGKSVVNIRTEAKEAPTQGQKPRAFSEGEGQTPFDFFFQIPPEQQNRSFSSLGSGFVIHPDGYIVTNHHVVDKASKILVTFRDEKKAYQATLIGSDAKTDLALIKVDHSNGKLTAAPVGDSDAIRTGDWVIAIGNPFRLGHTATVGIVSAKSRRIPTGGPYDSFIQTDASINPGNSGGPLFNAKGEVIGVNTAIYSPGRFGQTGFNIGIGFAIPINLVKTVISQVKDKGKVTRGWLGVLIQPVSSDVAEALKLQEARGALVADVVPNSPAAKAGLKRGDVITLYDGKPVQENDELPLMVAETELGKQVKIEVVRAGKPKEFAVTIEELKDEQEAEAGTESEQQQLGLTVQEVTPDIARSLGLEDNSGIVVTNVEPGSPAANAGLRRGDIVLEVGGTAVDSPAAFRDATKDLQPNKPLLLLVRRGNNTIFFTLKIE